MKENDPLYLPAFEQCMKDAELFLQEGKTTRAEVANHLDRVGFGNSDIVNNQYLRVLLMYVYNNMLKSRVITNKEALGLCRVARLYPSFVYHSAVKDHPLKQLKVRLSDYYTGADLDRGLVGTLFSESEVSREENTAKFTKLLVNFVGAINKKDKQSAVGRSYASNVLFDSLAEKWFYLFPDLDLMTQFLFNCTQNGLVSAKELKGIALLMRYNPDFVVSTIRTSSTYDSFKNMVKITLNSTNTSADILNHFV